MKSQKRKFGFISKGKHIIANKKQEWKEERDEIKDMKAKAQEKGKQRAKEARRRQYEREAEEKFKRRYGVTNEARKTSPAPRAPIGQPSEPYDPFGMNATPRQKKKGGSRGSSEAFDFGFSDNWKK